MTAEKSNVNNAIKTCSSCSELISNNISKCNMCHKWFHAVKECLKSFPDMPDSLLISSQDINHIFRTCFECNLSSKFNNINVDKLNDLKFNPFQTNNNVALSQHNTNLDKSLNINEIDCNYYLPTEFITKSEKHFN